MEYRAITSENFYYLEIKRVAKILNESIVSKENLREYLKENNLLEAKTEGNFSKKYSSLNKRVNSLTPFMIEVLATEDSEIGKFVNLYAILSSERILKEFMEEVIKERYSLNDTLLTKIDFIDFMLVKKEQSSTVASWSEGGVNKVIEKLKNFLVEGGYLKKEKEFFRILKPYIPEDVIEIFKTYGDVEIVKSMLY